MMMILMAILGTVNGMLIHRLWMARKQRSVTYNLVYRPPERGKYTLGELLAGLKPGGA